MGRILIGISSWADAGLVRSDFYPAEVNTSSARLSYYAARFPVAEIDSSYHFFPTQRNLKLWLENTPRDFTFDVKAFSLFTLHPTPVSSLPRAIREKYRDQLPDKPSIYLHHLPQEAVDELWSGFTGIIQSFQAAGKLGAILFQFPPWFYPEPRNFDHIVACRERLMPFQLALEFRVSRWFDADNRDKTLDFLRQQGSALVCVDEPQGFRTSVPPMAEVTAPLAIVRFHGRNAENWERKGIVADDRFSYLYREEELREWVPRIGQMAKTAREVHVIFKNKHADFPIQNARQMRRLLGLDD